MNILDTFRRRSLKHILTSYFFHRGKYDFAVSGSKCGASDKYNIYLFAIALEIYPEKHVLNIKQPRNVSVYTEIIHLSCIRAE